MTTARTTQRTRPASASVGVGLISADAAANVLGVSRRTVYNLAHRREIPHVWIGGSLKFDRRLLAEWIHRQMENSHAPLPAQRTLVRQLLRDGPEDGHPEAVPAVSWADGEDEAAGAGGRAEDAGGDRGDPRPQRRSRRRTGGTRSA